jgi:hypothetical protein
MRIGQRTSRLRVALIFCQVLGLALLPLHALAVDASISQYTGHLWQMEDGLPHTIVQAIVQTHDGYLWVGTREGLARFDGVRFIPFKFPGETPQPSITSLCEGQDNSLWIATQTVGLLSSLAVPTLLEAIIEKYHVTKPSAPIQIADGVALVHRRGSRASVEQRGRVRKKVRLSTIRKIDLRVRPVRIDRGIELRTVGIAAGESQISVSVGYGGRQLHP